MDEAKETGQLIKNQKGAIEDSVHAVKGDSVSFLRARRITHRGSARNLRNFQYHSVRNALLTEEELHTAICGAEEFLNSRPITFASSSSDDMVPLIPSHFLVGHLNKQFAPEAVEIFSPKKRWQRIQQLIGHFWKRWRKTIIWRLNVRGKWFHLKGNVSCG